MLHSTLGQLKMSAAANMDTEMVLPNLLGVLINISWSRESHLFDAAKKQKNQFEEGRERERERVHFPQDHLDVSGNCRSGGATHP